MQGIQNKTKVLVQTVKVYLPCQQEFGYELLHVVPRINGDTDEKIIVHERDKNSLYPNATKRLIITPMNSSVKGVGVEKTTKEIWNSVKEYFGPGHKYIEPALIRGERKWFVPQVRDLEFEIDVVVFPRKKKYMAAKNWSQWHELVDALKAEGLKVFAGGCGFSSEHVNCPSAWDYANHLDATIYAILHSKIRLGIITALHILSVMCGRETWVLTNKKGMSHIRSNTPPNISYIRTADHLNAGVKTIPLLEDVRGIVNAVAYRCSS